MVAKVHNVSLDKQRSQPAGKAGRDKSKAVMKPPGSKKPVQQTNASTTAQSSSKKVLKDRNAGAVVEEGESQNETAILRREIQALGGDQADFDLLKDIDNDSEDDAIVGETTESKDDKALARELKSFMASLGDFGKAYENTKASESEIDAENQENEEPEREDNSNESTADDDSDAEESLPTSASIESTAKIPAEAVTLLPASTKRAQATTAQPLHRSGLLVDPNPLWYETPLPELPPAEVKVVAASTVAQLHERGKTLLSDLGAAFSGSLKSGTKSDPLAASSTLSASDRTFISTILSSGTSSDKLSALILLSSSSPIHTTNHLSQLLSLTKKKSRDEAVRAVRAIVDWLKGGGGAGSAAGLPDKKLRWFVDQPQLSQLATARQGGMKVNGKEVGDEHLVVWAFEDWLKKWYFELLQAIETLSHDPLPFVRTQMTGFLADLLSAKPEQEQNLLRLLVDKLGDSDRTVSSRASYHLLQILQQHPQMKHIVVKEIASVVLRPIAPLPASKSTSHGKGKGKAHVASVPVGQLSAAAGARSSDHARYYGIITLNQVMLSRSAAEKLVANRLIEIYFDIFRDLLGFHSSDVEEISQNGPAPKDRKRRRDEKSGKKQSDTKDATSGLPRQERRKIEKIQAAQESESKLMAAVLTGVNRAFPYSDIEGDVLHNRADTLFKILHTSTFNVGIQALTLLFQVSATQQAVSDRFYTALYETLIDARLASCSKQAMYLNLLFKAIKADTSAKRVAAFVKRIIQILSIHQPPFVCGALFLLGELFKLTPGLVGMLNEPEQADDDVEVFKDAPDGEADDGDSIQGEAALKPSETSAYDGRKRNPAFANAQNSCLWEIIPLLRHFHPSVALHAAQLLANVPITTTPDLELHTLSHFLDRFVYRNAKKKVAAGQESLMKPGANGLDRSGLVLLRKGAAAITEDQLNTAKFTGQKASDVPADQQFFLKFFTTKKADAEAEEKVEKMRKRKTGTMGDEDEDFDEQDDVESLGDLSDDDDDIDESIAADASAAVDRTSEASDDEDEEDEEVVLIQNGETDADEGSELDEEQILEALSKSLPPDMSDDDEYHSESDISDSAFAYEDTDEETPVDTRKEADAEDAELEVDEELGEAMMQGIDIVASDEDEETSDEQAGDDHEEDEEEVVADGNQSGRFDSDGDDEDIDAFLEEDDAVFDSDEDIELGGKVSLPASGKSKNNDRKEKKRKLKHLPAFASAEDWAALIDDGEEDNL